MPACHILVAQFSHLPWPLIVFFNSEMYQKEKNPKIYLSWRIIKNIRFKSTALVILASHYFGS